MMHGLWFICFCGLAVVGLWEGNAQVIRAETPTGSFSADTSMVPATDLTPPEIILREPVQVATRGFMRVELPRLSLRSATVSIRGIARDSSGIATVTVAEKEAVLSKHSDGIHFSAVVPLIIGENLISITAVDRAKKENHLTLIVNREVGLVIGKYYALLIAVEKYEDPRLESLTNPIRDAESLKTVLTTAYEFEPTNVKVLKNPDRRAILSAFGELRTKLTRDDNLLIFYAGHGYWDPEMKQGFWLPSNARKDDQTEWVSNGTIRDNIRGIKSQHTLLIADACFSGSIFQERGGIRPDAAVEKIYELPSRRAITSGVDAVPDESVFLSCLIKDLRDNTAPFLTAEQLFVQMKNVVISNSPVNQIPRYGTIVGADDAGGDYVFSRR